MLLGRKRWALYPPSAPFPLPGVPRSKFFQAPRDRFEGTPNPWGHTQPWMVEGMDPLEYFGETLPALSNSRKTKLVPASSLPAMPLECMLRPNETIVVPSGYWHTVLNTETTFAVTENFMSPSNAAEVLKELNARPAESIPQKCYGILCRKLKERLAEEKNEKKTAFLMQAKKKLASSGGRFKQTVD